MAYATSLTQQGFSPSIFVSVTEWVGSFAPRNIDTDTKFSVAIRRSSTTKDYTNHLIVLQNLVKSFGDLPIGWDGYSAKPIPNKIITNSLNLLNSIDLTLPEIYPTGRESIQFEYDQANYSLEIEIFSDSFEISVFHNADLVSEESHSISDTCKLKEKIRNFYE